MTEHHTVNRDFSVNAILASWTRQAGYPLITVERNYERGLVTLKQERYFSPQITSRDNSAWWIPFNYATARYSDFGETLPNGWMLPTEQEKEIHVDMGKDDWIIFNKQQTAYYRVLYDETNYKLIAKQLNSENYAAIHVLNRAQLLNDLNEFESAGRVKLEQLIDVLSYLKRETEYAPWQAAQKALLRLNSLLAGQEQFNQFRAFAANLVRNHFENIGINEKPNESMLTTQLRPIIVDLACQFGIEHCLTFTHDQLADALRNEIHLSPNATALIFKNGARLASAEEVQSLWARSIESRSSGDRDLYASSVGHTKQTELLETYLYLTLNEYPDEYQPIGSWRSSLFRSVANNGQRGLQLCIQFIKKHAMSVKQLYSFRRFSEFVLELAPLVATEDGQKEVGPRPFFHCFVVLTLSFRFVLSLVRRPSSALGEKQTHGRGIREKRTTSSATEFKVDPDKDAQCRILVNLSVEFRPSIRAVTSAILSVYINL